MVEFSQRLRQLRLEKHLTQVQVAKRIGVTPAMVSSYETDIRTPSPDVLLRIADLFGTSLDYLFGRTEARTLDISDLTPSESAAVFSIIAAFREDHHA